jgi:ribosomal protein L11 methylase PrmA
MGSHRRAAVLDSLRRTVEKLTWQPAGTAWVGYAETMSYSEAAAVSKARLVSQLLEAAGGTTVWDLGANVGRFSAVAASLGRTVVAWDGDPGATELHYQTVRASSLATVIPLLADLANPSPGLGWANAERRSLVERSNADVVVALALVHHLVIGRNIRLAMVADFLARLGPELIIEFIPDSDPMARQLLETRDDVRPGLTIDGFRAVFEMRFEVLDDLPIEDSPRRLLRMRRR